MKAWKLKYVKIFTFVFFLLGCALQMSAQAKFYTRVSEGSIGYKRTFQVQYIIEGAKEIKDFASVKFSDFKVEDEFEIPTTATISPETLQMVDVYSRIVVLSPKRTGTLVVPGASAKIDGKLMRSNAVQVVVQQSGLSSLPDPEMEKERVEDESEIKPGETIEKKNTRQLLSEGGIKQNHLLCGGTDNGYLQSLLATECKFAGGAKAVIDRL